MKRKWKIGAVCLAVFALLLSGSIMVFADGGTFKIGVSGTFGQTEAREMFDMINELRTGDDAWYLDANGQEIYDELQPVEYDYALEEEAMQRAMETAFSFSAIRPNGEPSESENEIFAIGSSAQKVFDAWKNASQNNYQYRAKMLNPKFSAIGVGHVYYNKTHYWVVLFSSDPSGASETEPVDEKKRIVVEISPDRIQEMGTSVSSISIPFGSSAPVPAVNSLRMKDANPDVANKLTIACSWTVAPGGENIISISESGTITANKTGTASVTAQVLGKTVSVPVTVTPKDLSSATVSLSQDTYTYDGTAKEPAVTSVVLEGKTLTAGQDYTVSCSGNVNPGTASVTVTGTGNYTGSASKTFTIKEESKPEEDKPEDSKPSRIAAGTAGKADGVKYKVIKAGVSGSAEVEYVGLVKASKASVTIPSSVKIKGFKCKVTSIAAGAFKNNKKVKNVTIPSSVKKIGKQAFYNCKNLTRITIKSKNLTAKTVGANAFGKPSKKLTIKVPAAKLKAYKKLFKSKGLGSKGKVVK